MSKYLTRAIISGSRCLSTRSGTIWTSQAISTVASRCVVSWKKTVTQERRLEKVPLNNRAIHYCVWWVGWESGVIPICMQKSLLLAYICMRLGFFFCMRLQKYTFCKHVTEKTFWRNFLSYFKKFTLKIKAKYGFYYKVYYFN